MERNPPTPLALKQNSRKKREIRKFPGQRLLSRIWFARSERRKKKSTEPNI
jgi:hypothetical protein